MGKAREWQDCSVFDAQGSLTAAKLAQLIDRADGAVHTISLARCGPAARARAPAVVVDRGPCSHDGARHRCPGQLSCAPARLPCLLALLTGWRGLGCGQAAWWAAGGSVTGRCASGPRRPRIHARKSARPICTTSATALAARGRVPPPWPRASMAVAARAPPQAAQGRCRGPPGCSMTPQNCAPTHAARRPLAAGGACRSHDAREEELKHRFAPGIKHGVPLPHTRGLRAMAFTAMCPQLRRLSLDERASCIGGMTNGARAPPPGAATPHGSLLATRARHPGEAC